MVPEISVDRPEASEIAKDHKFTALGTGVRFCAKKIIKMGQSKT